MDTSQLDLAFEFAQYTNHNIFLTGKAGTGKTTFLHRLRKNSLKRIIVVAPTGVAAINAGGVTIHSFFQLPIGMQNHIKRQNPGNGEDPGKENTFQRISKRKLGIIRSLDLLIIDEISMVRADVLDGIDDVLRKQRRNQAPFGGVQLLMIGDLHQLPPVMKDDEWNILKSFYETGFFFSSHALKRTKFISIELKHIFRQSDEFFINLLSKVRDNRLDDEALEALNSRYVQGYKPEEGTIILTTHNNQAHSINEGKLAELKEELFKYQAEVEGEFPEYSYPVDYELSLKVGAQVMFLRNDSSPEKRYYNGKIGRVTELGESSILVICPDEQEEIEVGIDQWENIRYDLDENTREIRENIIGTFRHYPLKLAWAITIHKSQGLTFEKAVIDARAAFAFGQVYVALSRCRSLDGLVLSSMITRQCIKSDESVSRFSGHADRESPGREFLEKSKRDYQLDLIMETYNYGLITGKLSYLIKLLKENEGSIPEGSLERLNQARQSLRNDLSDIAEKFLTQIQGIIRQSADIDKDEYFRDRLEKAGKYFREKSETIVCGNILSEKIPTDNKALRKSIQELFSQISDDIRIRLACFSSCESGFSLHKFLSERAKASVEDISGFTPGKESEEIVSFNPEVYKLLKSWRERVAHAANLPSFKILREPILVKLASLSPLTLEDLKKSKILSAKKTSQFGPVIVSMIREHRLSKGEDLPEDDTASFQLKSKKKVKGGSQLLSLQMFRSGQTVEAIAAERKLTVSTILGHLHYCLARGEISLNELVPTTKAEIIRKYFESASDAGLGLARQNLGEDFSFHELRCVLSSMKVDQSIKS
jgi:hypothetical protein